MENTEIILSKDALKKFNELSKKSITSKNDFTIVKAIHKKANLILQNKNYGNPIAKKLIPKYYKEKYNVRNLFRVELPFYWRMLYSLTSENEITIIALVVDITNHDDYNKKFGYKKK